jgi:hypothetical protein
MPAPGPATLQRRPFGNDTTDDFVALQSLASRLRSRSLREGALPGTRTHLWQRSPNLELPRGFRVKEATESSSRLRINCPRKGGRMPSGSAHLAAFVFRVSSRFGLPTQQAHGDLFKQSRIQGTKAD